MSTTTIETKITYKYLMSKSKDWLATEYLRLLEQLDGLQKAAAQPMIAPDAAVCTCDIHSTHPSNRHQVFCNLYFPTRR